MCLIIFKGCPYLNVAKFMNWKKLTYVILCFHEFILSLACVVTDNHSKNGMPDCISQSAWKLRCWFYKNSCFHFSVLTALTYFSSFHVDQWFSDIILCCSWLTTVPVNLCFLTSLSFTHSSTHPPSYTVLSRHSVLKLMFIYTKNSKAQLLHIVLDLKRSYS